MTGVSEKLTISVEVVYATRERQELVTLELEKGSTVADAIDHSGLAELFGNFELDDSRVGIFSRKVTPEEILRDGDRVEIYRPLHIDPKEERRQRALLQNRK